MHDDLQLELSGFEFIETQVYFCVSVNRSSDDDSTSTCLNHLPRSAFDNWATRQLRSRTWTFITIILWQQCYELPCTTPTVASPHDLWHVQIQISETLIVHSTSRHFSEKFERRNLGTAISLDLILGGIAIGVAIFKKLYIVQTLRSDQTFGAMVRFAVYDMRQMSRCKTVKNIVFFKITSRPNKYFRGTTIFLKISIILLIYFSW